MACRSISAQFTNASPSVEFAISHAITQFSGSIFMGRYMLIDDAHAFVVHAHHIQYWPMTSANVMCSAAMCAAQQ